MINVKKGTAHSLQQSDVRGTWVTGVVSGMVCHINTTGAVVVGGPENATTGLLGFAINDSTDGDAKESNKIALYTLDGSSIIETDQTGATAITAANFPIGTPVYAWDISGTSPGAVTTTSTGHVVGPIGWVEGIRNLQADGNQTFTAQNYTSVDSQGNVSTKSNTYSGQKNIPVVAIKLAAYNGAGAS